jgi:hypothetical protein
MPGRGALKGLTGPPAAHLRRLQLQAAWRRESAVVPSMRIFCPPRGLGLAIATNLRRLPPTP